MASGMAKLAQFGMLVAAASAAITTRQVQLVAPPAARRRGSPTRRQRLGGGGQPEGRAPLGDIEERQRPASGRRRSWRRSSCRGPRSGRSSGRPVSGRTGRSRRRRRPWTTNVRPCRQSAPVSANGVGWPATSSGHISIAAASAIARVRAVTGRPHALPPWPASRRRWSRRRKAGRMR